MAESRSLSPRRRREAAVASSMLSSAQAVTPPSRTAGSSPMAPVSSNLIKQRRATQRASASRRRRQHDASGASRVDSGADSAPQDRDAVHAARASAAVATVTLTPRSVRSTDTSGSGASGGNRLPSLRRTASSSSFRSGGSGGGLSALRRSGSTSSSTSSQHSEDVCTSTPPVPYEFVMPELPGRSSAPQQVSASPAAAAATSVVSPPLIPTSSRSAVTTSGSVTVVAAAAARPSLTTTPTVAVLAEVQGSGTPPRSSVPATSHGDGSGRLSSLLAKAPRPRRSTSRKQQRQQEQQHDARVAQREQRTWSPSVPLSSPSTPREERIPPNTPRSCPSPSSGHNSAMSARPPSQQSRFSSSSAETGRGSPRMRRALSSSPRPLRSASFSSNGVKPRPPSATSARSSLGHACLPPILSPPPDESAEARAPTGIVADADAADGGLEEMMQHGSNSGASIGLADTQVMQHGSNSDASIGLADTQVMQRGTNSGASIGLADTQVMQRGTNSGPSIGLADTQVMQRGTSSGPSIGLADTQVMQRGSNSDASIGMEDPQAMRRRVSAASSFSQADTKMMQRRGSSVSRLSSAETKVMQTASGTKKTEEYDDDDDDLDETAVMQVGRTTTDGAASLPGPDAVPKHASSPVPPGSRRPDSVILDEAPQFDVLDKLGRGKFSTVYQAVSRDTGHILALKRVQVFDVSDPKARESLINESSLLTLFDHPNIIRCYAAFIVDNELNIALELAATDLLKVIRSAAKNNKPFSEYKILTWFLAVCSGVEEMHRQRIMHRDIKPANVLMTMEGIVKLGDLGLGRYLSSGTFEATSLVGTPYYMAPERILEENYGFASDIWSMGCLLYEMVMLTPPFHEPGLNLYTLGKKIYGCDYRPVDTSYSPQLRAIITDILIPHPDKRPSAAQLRQMTSDALAVCERPVSVLSRTDGSHV